MKTNKKLATLTFCKNVIKQFVLVTLFLEKYIYFKETEIRKKLKIRI